MALTFVAILSMVMGNLLALKQDNVKRLLGYSSVAHMGYLLITVIIFTAPGVADLAREASVWVPYCLYGIYTRCVCRFNHGG